MTRTQALTGGVIASTVGMLIAYDIWIAVEASPGDTISEVMLIVALGNPIVPFALGVIIGHLFWPQRTS